MKIRSITANEIEAFAMIAHSKFKQTLINMWKDNESSPEWCFVVEKHVELFKQVGFDLIQEKQSYVLEQMNEPIIIQNKLIFRTLSEISNKTFIDAIKQVTVGALDNEDYLELKNLGAEKAALNYFNILKDIDYRPIWWFLAYNSDGILVGLVVPQKFSNKEGAINYIGVVPDHRGHGYVHDLLAKGTSILKTYGIKHIIADIDVNNIPMANALSRAGYKKKQTMWVYKIELN